MFDTSILKLLAHIVTSYWCQNIAHVTAHALYLYTAEEKRVTFPLFHLLHFLFYCRAADASHLFYWHPISFFFRAQEMTLSVGDWRTMVLQPLGTISQRNVACVHISLAALGPLVNCFSLFSSPQSERTHNAIILKIAEPCTPVV